MNTSDPIDEPPVTAPPRPREWGVPILIRYTQPPDDDDEHQAEQQYLEIESCNAGAGPFVVIRTARWAFDPDGIDAFCAALKAAAATDPLRD